MQDAPSQTFPQAVLWPIARVLLIVGLVCLGLRAFHSPAETSWTAFVLRIFIWAEQLEQLEAALGGQAQQQAVGASAANCIRMYKCQGR
jgi:hypothetical protein